MILPRKTGWQLPDDGGEYLRALVERNEPSLILECGSGRSTLYLAQACADFGGYVCSLEHLEGFAKDTADGLVANGLQGKAYVEWAPLQEFDGGLLWYDYDAWKDLRDIQMLFVDGPPGHTAEFARAPALPLLGDRLAPGCIVVLDDMNRKQEKQIWASWRALGLSAPDFVGHSGGYLGVGRMPL